MSAALGADFYSNRVGYLRNSCLCFSWWRFTHPMKAFCQFAGVLAGSAFTRLSNSA
jgi:hypothetical protein